MPKDDNTVEGQTDGNFVEVAPGTIEERPLKPLSRKKQRKIEQRRREKAEASKKRGQEKFEKNLSKSLRSLENRFGKKYDDPRQTEEERRVSNNGMDKSPEELGSTVDWSKQKSLQTGKVNAQPSSPTPGRGEVKTKPKKAGRK